VIRHRMSRWPARVVRAWTGSTPPQVARSRRTLLTVGVIGQLFALALLISSWSLYHQPIVVLAVWAAMSAALPLATLLAARAGGLSGRRVIPVIGLLAVADLVVPAEAVEQRIGPAGWNWGAVAISLLALAVYRPVPEVITCGLLHAAAVVGWALVEPVDPGTVVLVAAGAIIPPLGAAQFVNFYVGVLNEREEAGRRAAQILAREAAEAAVELDGRRRLARIRAEVAPVLEYVAAGARLPLDREHAAGAARAADRLRAELLAGRDLDWLLRSAGTGSPEDEMVDVQVLSDPVARRRLDDETRSAVGSLVGLLRRHRPWDRMAVTITAREDLELAVTVVATGAGAGPAGADPAVETAARRLGADVTVIDGQSLVIEGTVRVNEGAAPAAASPFTRRGDRARSP
jgi:hypothetical protein